MKKKAFLIAPILVVIITLLIALAGTEKATSQDRVSAFTGITKIDGTPTDGITVLLAIGSKNYRTVSAGPPAGTYNIGRFHDTGLYCLKADTTVGLVNKRDAEEGNKQQSGTIHVDLNLTSLGPQCQPTDE